MNTSFVLEREDARRFHRYLMRTRPGYRADVLFVAGFFPAMVMVFGELVSHFSLSPLGTLGMIGGCLAITGYAAWRFGRQHPVKVAERNRLLGQHTISIDSDGIDECTDRTRAVTPWPLVTTIETDQQAMYLFTGSTAARIIPWRSFSRREDAIAFFDAAVRFHRAAASWRYDNLCRHPALSVEGDGGTSVERWPFGIRTAATSLSPWARPSSPPLDATLDVNADGLGEA